MKTAAFLILSIFFLYMTGSAQNTKQTIEKLSADPKTMTNAAKADVYIVNSKKVISDTSGRKSDSKISQRKKYRTKSQNFRC